MNRMPTSYRDRCLAMLVLLLMILPGSGCIGLAANLINAWSGNVVEPEFDGLRKRRVAVVCLSDSAAYGPSPVSDLLAVAVGNLLRENVEDIRVIEQKEIDNWRDNNDWDQIDYREIGDGMDAETVVAIDLGSFSLHEGQTMYIGRAEVSVVVYDMTQGGREVFTRLLPPQTFPANGACAATDTTDAKFRRKFIQHLAGEIARHFYAYDLKEDFARDTSLIAP